MAPGILAEQPTAPHLLSKQRNNNHAPKNIFPDGIRTSGQLDPIFDVLEPYNSFPKKITGPTVWNGRDYQNSPEKWVHRFTPEEIKELDEASDKFIQQGIPLTGISQVGDPECAALLADADFLGQFPSSNLVETLA